METAIARRVLWALGALALNACSEAGLAVVNAPARWNGSLEIETAEFAPGLMLDVYRLSQDAPQTPTRRDLVVFFYGGRWTSGERRDYLFMGERLAKAGFIAVIPDYRKYPDVKFPAFVQDGAAALQWIADNPDLFPRSSGTIHVLGHSAGAHIGALLATDKRYGVSKLIGSFAGLAGPYDFTPEAEDLKDMFGPPDRYRQMQVTSFIDGREPPMLLLHGRDDTTVETYNYQRLAAAIRSEGGTVSVKTYPGVTHTGIMRAFTWLEPGSQVSQDVTAFFNGR